MFWPRVLFDPFCCWAGSFGAFVVGALVVVHIILLAVGIVLVIVVGALVLAAVATGRRSTGTPMACRRHAIGKDFLSSAAVQ